MSEPGTKACRHCGEPILQVARICKHCHSNQGWFSSNRDPRYTFVALAIIAALTGAFAFALPRRLGKQVDRALKPDTSCVGLVTVKASNHFTRLVDGRDRLFVRVQLDNQWTGDVSDPALRVLVFGPSGAVEDTFIRGVYDANLPPKQLNWVRVDGDLATDPDKIKEVRADVVSIDCKPAWQ